MRKVMLAAAVLLLAGCATNLGGNKNSVVVLAGTMRMDAATAQAEEHCAKFGRTAVFTGKPAPMQYAFNCVKDD